MTTPSGSTQIGMALPGGASMPTTPVNLSGWQPAGNFGVNQQGTYGQTVGGKADIPLGGGAKATVTVSTPISKAALATSAGMVLKNAARIGIPAVGAVMTASAIKDLFDLGKVYFDENGTQEKPVYTFKKSRECSTAGPNPGETHAYVNDSAITSVWGSWMEGNSCTVGFIHSCTKYSFCPFTTPKRIVSQTIFDTKTYITPDEATALISSHQARADALQQLINLDKEHKSKNGVNPFGYVAPTIALDTPTITGPATVPGPKSTETESVRLKPGTNVLSDPGTTTPTDPGTKVTTKEQTHRITYEGDKITQTTVTNTVTNITNNTTNITTTEGEKVEEKDPEVKDPEDPATDTPLGDIPNLYERKYPDGLVGIWNDKKQSLKGSSVGNLVGQIVPKGMGDGGCPQWQIPLDIGIVNYGTHNLSIPCEYWAYLRIIMIVGSLFLARALIFGG